MVAIQLTRLQLPTLVRLGNPAQLSCDFRLEPGESLYSVKWYKNSIEFFRYIAGSGAIAIEGEQREFTVYPQIGVYLDVSTTRALKKTLKIGPCFEKRIRLLFHANPV